ncbi:MAG: beta-ketoacyl-ACP synthase II, partial [Terriglobales bacterium]
MRRRVVVTGVGLVSALGCDAPSTWAGLMAARSGIAPITHFDASAFSCRFAAEVKDFDPLRYVEKKDVKKMDPFIQFAMAAASEAMAQAGLEVTDELAPRVGVHIGSGIGGFATIEREHSALLEGGPRRVSPFFIPASIVNLAAGQVSIKHRARGPNSAACTACASGAHSIGDALRLIQHGYADAMIAGGAEAAITPLSVAGFASMRALSTRNDDPARASRPFDLTRDGFVIGEGAGILIVEELEFARARGAKILAEVIGYGMSADAHHMTGIAPEGQGAQRSMRAALKD